MTPIKFSTDAASIKRALRVMWPYHECLPPSYAPSYREWLDASVRCHAISICAPWKSDLAIFADWMSEAAFALAEAAK